MEIFKDLYKFKQEAYENRYVDTQPRDRNKIRMYVLTGIFVVPGLEWSYTKEVIGVYTTMRKAQKEKERWEKGFKNRVYTKCCQETLFLKKVNEKVIMEFMPEKGFDRCPYCGENPLLLTDSKEYEHLEIEKINLNESKFRENNRDKTV